jgi:hypothetical protein
MRRVMEDAIARRSVLTGSVARDLFARVAIAVKPRELAARNLQPHVILLQIRASIYITAVVFLLCQVKGTTGI